MKPDAPSFPIGRTAGFTQADLLIVLAVLAVLTAFAVLAISKVSSKRKLLACESNLQQVNKAVLLFSEEHEQLLPSKTAPGQGDLWWWYKEQVKGYIGLTGPSNPREPQFSCPNDRGYSDPQPFCATARFDYSSYAFNGVNTLGTPNIAGHKVSSISEPVKTLLVMEWCAHAPLSWHRSRTGRANAPFYSNAESVTGFVDGHVALTPIYYDGYTAAYTRDPIPGYTYKFSGSSP